LALEPEMLLLDEPTAHVDHANAQLIEDVIREMQAETGMTVILASHDPRQAHKLADRVVTLFDGELICGTTETVLKGIFCEDEHGGLSVCEEAMRLPLAPAAVSGESSDPPPPLGVPLQLAIDTECLEVCPKQPSDSEANVGRIESVQQYHGQCRLQIRMSLSRTLHADVPLAAYQAARLNVGLEVTVRIGDTGIRRWTAVE
jgi:energy-coupling factor transporter ATP-binding protein EcfA2